MKFLHLFHKEVEFGNIEGYDDIKGLVKRVLSSDENYNLLFCGPPAMCKEKAFFLTSPYCKDLSSSRRFRDNNA